MPKIFQPKTTILSLKIGPNSGLNIGSFDRKELENIQVYTPLHRIWEKWVKSRKEMEPGINM